MKATSAITFLIGSKFLLDFISPFRHFNFLFVASIAAFVIFSKIGNFKISKKLAALISSYFLAVILSCINGGILNAVPFLISPIFFISVYLLLKDISNEDRGFVFNRLIKIFVFALIINLAISFIYFDPMGRSFYNFEHANLFGTYALLIIPLVYASRQGGNLSIKDKISIIFPSLISTSTGAAILSLFASFKMPKLSVKNIIAMSFYMGLLGYVCAFLIKSFDYDLYVKIFGPVSLIIDGKIIEIYDLAVNGRPIQELGDDYQSSLTWRFYAYVVYFNYFLNSAFYSILFGGGAGSHVDVWGGMLPHNDYLMVLIDFGIIGFIFLFYSTIFFYRKCVSLGGQWLIFSLVLTLRLLLENNISSNYILSSIFIALAIVFSFKNGSSGSEVRG